MAGGLIEVDDARCAVLDCARALTYESERLANALGRVLAEEVRSVDPGNDVRRAGEEIGADEVVVAPGTWLGPAHLGVLASLGRAEVRCFMRPRVSVLTSGDELVAPGRELAHGAIYNSNSYSVPALAREAGAQVGLTTTVRDEPRATAEALLRALDTSDVVVICGGVSDGEHDHVRPTLAELGVVERFWGVALAPGEPTWFGVRDRTLVFGLPGDPVSATVTFTLFVAPALRALAGAPPAFAQTTAVLARDVAKRPGRAHAVRCRLRASADGWAAEPIGEERSHALASMLGADALALLPSDGAGARAGERVAIELLPGARPWLG
jgi:molybdopterin molybdotransferase